MTPDPIDLGAIRNGARGVTTVRLTNPTGREVAVDRVTTSCPCVGLDGLPVAVPAGGEAAVSVGYDPAEEPDFRGGLSVELTGFDGEAVAFRTRILLEGGLRTVRAF